MMGVFARNFTPYEGEDPYLHLCFSEGSEKKVLPLLGRLRSRGVRVWYCSGTPTDRTERAEMDRLMLGARITAVYLDESFRNDPAAKSRLLTCQQNGQPIICLNTDGGDSGLSIGLHADAFEVKLNRSASAEEAENALLHADSFSQELIGEPAKDGNSRLRNVIRTFTVLTAILIISGILWFVTHRPKAPTPADTVIISDEILRETVRDALGGGPLTEESLANVAVLRFTGDTLPDDLSGLSLLPHLETIEINQTAAKDAADYPVLFRYTIVLTGGESG